MSDTSSLSLSRETLISVTSKFFMAVFGFVGVVIFARVLGPTQYGVYETAFAAAVILTKLPAGVGSAIRKRVSEIDEDPAEYLSVGIAIHVGFVAVLALASLLFRDPLVGYFGDDAIVLGVVAIVATLGLFNVANRFYSGVGYPGLSTWVDGVRSVFTLGLQLAFVWVGYAAFGLIAGLALATLVSAGISLVAAGYAPGRVTRRGVERTLEFARYSVPNTFLHSFYNSIDVLLATALVGPPAAATYAVAKRLVMPGSFLSGSIGDALLVKSSGVDSKGGDTYQDLANSISYAGLLAIPIAFGALAIPDRLLVTVYGPAFSGAGLVLIGLALFQVGNAYRSPLQAVTEGVDRPDAIFRINLLVVAGHLPVAYVLGVRHGLVGIVAATVLAEVGRFVLYQLLIRAQHGTVVLPRPVFEQLTSGALMFLVVWGLATRVVTIRSWLWLSLVIGVGAGVYFLVLFAMSDHFRATARRTVPLEALGQLVARRLR